MELENIVANTVYIKAREGKRKGKSKKWKQILKFPHISTCIHLKNTIPNTYDYIVDQQPIGRELFRLYCCRKPQLARAIQFLDRVASYEVAPDEKRQEEAKEVYETYLDPKSDSYVNQVNGNQVTAIKESIHSHNCSKEIFNSCVELITEHLKNEPFKDFLDSMYFKRYLQWKWLESQPVTKKHISNVQGTGEGRVRGSLCMSGASDRENVRV